ncbi:hypothetical protein [Thauera sp. SDU_THAU2]|uniref:hypothetical protein n=1 Tax=Thauera sp. SDU_THAU2 TaxID=3136633 RepID=UPI00311E08E3
MLVKQSMKSGNRAGRGQAGLQVVRLRRLRDFRGRMPVDFRFGRDDADTRADLGRERSPED